MVVLIAPDKFKGSLSAEKVCEAIREGILTKTKNLTILSLPLADGGEGTLEILTKNSGGSIIQKKVTGPLFSPVDSAYGISNDGQIAFIEMARASGLQLLKVKERNPLKTTTLGTGELILDAIEKGARKIVLGIGGSATNDGGIGMALALGFKFFDKDKRELLPVGESLSALYNIRGDQTDPRIKDTEFITLCDVDNPLTGPRGAASVYGPQKGATPEMISILDNGLLNFRNIVSKTFNIDSDFPGAGAAGGLGAGARVFLGSKMRRGIDYIAEATMLLERIQEADLVITGEGKIDGQTLSGKVVHEVANIALRFHKKVVVVCGQNELSGKEVGQLNISQLITLADNPKTAEESMKNTFGFIKSKISSELNL